MLNSLNSPLTSSTGWSIVKDPKGPVALKPLVARRGSGSCPTLYETDRGTYVVQGYIVGSDAGVDLPDGESLVEIPAGLLAEAIRTLR